MGNILNGPFFISSIFLNNCCLYLCYILLDYHEEKPNFKNVCIVVLMTTCSTLINVFCPKPLKLILSIIILLTIFYKFVVKNLRKAFVLLIMQQLIIMISEIAFLGILNVIGLDHKTSFAVSSCNIFVGICILILLKTNVLKIIFNKMNEILKTMKQNEIVLYSLMIVSILIISTVESYVKLPTIIVLTTNSVIAVVFITIIIKFVSAKNNYQLISDKYQTSISSLKEYETMIDKYRVNNHENKNELMTIRNMIKAKDKNTIEYIDKLVDNKVKDNERIMYKTSKIPEGGLRATIYSKLTLMDKYKIKYTLDIANDVRTTDLINLGDDLILSICKILGVFLDNAIDEVKKLRKKNIDIELYIMDNYLNIDITNNFKGNLDMNRLGNKNYTTKGDGHGYGLALVNKIISENSNVLINEKSINGDRFTQTLKIKM